MTYEKCLEEEGLLDFALNVTDYPFSTPQSLSINATSLYTEISSDGEGLIIKSKCDLDEILKNVSKNITIT